ncbi:hypothetical protein ACFPRL_35925 [Pseudoclavibacter helvolus]
MIPVTTKNKPKNGSRACRGCMNFQTYRAMRPVGAQRTVCRDTRDARDRAGTAQSISSPRAGRPEVVPFRNGAV